MFMYRGPEENDNIKPSVSFTGGFHSVRSTGLEPVPVAGHAPQTCAYADSATTAEQHKL